MYVSERDGVAALFLYDFTTNAETQLTHAAVGDTAPRVSHPTARCVAFVRDGNELRVLDLASKQERVLATGHLTRGRARRGLVARQQVDRLPRALGARAFSNVFAVPAAGGAGRAVSGLPNGNANNISWSPDGTFIIFNTSQRTEESQTVARRPDPARRRASARIDSAICSEPTSPAARTSRRPRTTAPPTPARAPSPAAPTRSRARRGAAVEAGRDRLRDIRRRVSILPVGVDVNYQTISPDGRSLLLTASAGGQQNSTSIRSTSCRASRPSRGSSPRRRVRSRDAQFSPDGREVFYLERAASCHADRDTPGSRRSR